MARKSRFLSGAKIAPARVSGDMNVADLIDNAFLAYNAGRLQEGCRLFTERMLEDDVRFRSGGFETVGITTPAERIRVCAEQMLAGDMIYGLMRADAVKGWSS